MMSYEQRLPLGQITNLGKPSRKSLGPSKPAQSRVSLAPSATIQSRTSSIGPRQSIGVKSNRNSSIGPRQSGIGVKRNSTLYGGRSDPRPISDKGWLSQCIKKLIAFLTSHNYDKQLSPKLLVTPTAKDFYSIVHFLYRKIDPSFQWSPKPDEEVPLLFKAVKYPFQISKRSLSSVGSPHTWPYLLAALAWLVELLSYEEETQENNEDDADAPYKLFFPFLSKAYKDFLSGQDDFKQLEEELEATFDAKNLVVKQDVERLQAEKEKALAIVDQYVNQPSPLQIEERNKQIYSEDVAKYSLVVQGIKERVLRAQQKLQAVTKDLEQREKEAIAAEQERDELDQIVKKQEINLQDVERMQAEKNSLESLLSTLTSSRQQKEKTIYDKEIETAKKMEEVETAYQEYNSLARKYGLVPVNAKHAKGINFQIVFNSQNPTATIEHIKEVVEPKLKEIKLEFSAKLTNAVNDILVVNPKISLQSEQALDKKEELSRLADQLKKTEIEYQKEKQRMKDELKAKQAEVDKMEEDIKRLREARAEKMNNSSKSLELLKKEYDELVQRTVAMQEEAKNMLVVLLDHVMSHKSFVRDNLLTLQKVGVNYKSMLLSLPQPRIN